MRSVEPFSANSNSTRNCQGNCCCNCASDSNTRSTRAAVAADEPATCQAALRAKPCYSSRRCAHRAASGLHAICRVTETTLECRREHFSPDRRLSPRRDTKAPAHRPRTNAPKPRVPVQRPHGCQTPHHAAPSVKGSVVLGDSVIPLAAAVNRLRQPWYGWFVLGVLLLDYILNFIDRSVLGILNEAINRRSARVWQADGIYRWPCLCVVLHISWHSRRAARGSHGASQRDSAIEQ